MNQKKKVALQVDYQDSYVEPKILSALQKTFPQHDIIFVQPDDALPSHLPTLQWRAYEGIDFAHALTYHNRDTPHLVNSYVIRKALIRKHYLAHTILSHVTKHPSSSLRLAFPTTVDFELDYAEFLDEALVEAFELRESFAYNQDRPPHEREWWILKPSMSDRGQGIRLFSTEEELSGIFEAWEADEPDSDGEDVENVDLNDHAAEGIITSHLRHFVAQRYVSSPLLIPRAPFSNRKFHIRTYVVAAGALSVYVHDCMLALFASEAYSPPWEIMKPQTNHNSNDRTSTESLELLQRMRSIHLTNTCVQNSSSSTESKAENVYLLSRLPLSQSQHASIRSQIQQITAELFCAAISHPTNFQPLPQSFEIFGIDFLVASQPSTEMDVQIRLLEVNAFPDFAQTGDNLGDVVVQQLFHEIVSQVIAPALQLNMSSSAESSTIQDKHLIKVLEKNIGR